MLFEEYFWLYGKQSLIKEYKEMLKREGTPNGGWAGFRSTPAWRSFCDKLKVDMGPKFLGYLILRTSSQSQKANNLLSTVTSMTKHFGLSNNGVTFLAALGFGQSLRTQQTKDSTMREAYRENVADLMAVSDMSVTVWLDNFSRFWFKRKATVTSELMLKSEGSACGLLVSSLAPPAMFLLDATGSAIPCMDVTAMFTARNACAAARYMENLYGNHRQKMDTYYATAYAITKEVWNSPLKPPLGPGEVASTPFRPMGFLPHDCGSTRGFWELLNAVQEMLRTSHWEENKYSTIVLDVDLWLRSMTYMTSTSRRLPDLARHNLITFALWHPAKILLKKVFEHTWLTVLAPVLRHLHPGQVLHRTNTHQQRVFIVNIVCRAYKDERHRFLRAYTGSPDNPGVAYIRQVMEYLLPLVSNSAYDCSTVLFCKNIVYVRTFVHAWTAPCCACVCCLVPPCCKHEECANQKNIFRYIWSLSAVQLL